MGQHVKKPDTDPVKIWFFITLGVLAVATGVFIWVMLSGYHV